MEIVPVVDVRGGVAVAAVRGDRARYRPLETPLAATADPVAVALGLASLFPFAMMYVADLDGIEGRGADLETQRRLADAWPGSELWIDDGSAGAPSPARDARDLSPMGRGEETAAPFTSPRWGGAGAVHAKHGSALTAPGEGALGDKRSAGERVMRSHVLGSESLASLSDYERVRDAAGPLAPLSLDFRGDEFIGPRELLDDAALWPDRVIVMTLARVGSGEGPELLRLQSIIARAGARKIYAAGGVRNADDLRALGDIGVAGALVATALHTGAITSRDLKAIYSGS